MRPSTVCALGAASLLACTGPTDPAPSLDGLWSLDSSSAGVPPRTMTLNQRGTVITGFGTAMGVDVPIQITVTGTYDPPTTTSPAAATLHFAFDNGGGVTVDYAGTLASADLLVGSAVYYNITTAPISASLSFRRVRPSDGSATGLEGTVRRGPITPVCQVGIPCDAPFSGSFQVWGSRFLAARFRSDSAGRYEVLLSPGTYSVVPDSGAAVWPSGQSRAVTVGPVGLTHADLEFDTGIR
jgi:hypothetical protein